MRIVSWNCCDAFERKHDVLLDFKPDIAVISECTAASLNGLPEGYKHLYVPSEKIKGVAFIYREELILSEPEVGGQIVAAVEVSGPCSFRLVAVWPCATGLKTETYVHEIHRALQQHPLWLQSPVVLAGDFNSHTQWDKGSGTLSFSALVRDLAGHGIRSVYHRTTGKEHGDESEHTFSFRWKAALPFHIDYIFASEEFFADGHTFQMGERGEYLAKKYSDHVPLISDFTTNNL